MQELDKIQTQALNAINACEDPHSLDQIKSQYLGKKSELTELLKSLGQLSAEERPKVGQLVNQAKSTIENALRERSDLLKNKELEKKLHSESIDVTLPGRGQTQGSAHPVTKTRRRIEQIFKAIGFNVAEGLEIEDQKYNFEMLNMPSHHPAREMQDTFYLPDGRVLRTHTSPVQVHEMIKNKDNLPIRIIAPGRVYRSDFDATHTPMFNQVEGLIIDKGINFSHLKGIINYFITEFFEASLETRFRASYFPFTEPSAEVDMECVICRRKQADCKVCKGGGWLEVLGCGLVHPNVLKGVGIDSEIYTGLAFGAGMDRLAMLRYRINDLRLMFENDVRFLGQFS
jgi:phenylalanyl-tRNA synthetase alpha chain